MFNSVNKISGRDFAWCLFLLLLLWGGFLTGKGMVLLYEPDIREVLVRQGIWKSATQTQLEVIPAGRKIGEDMPQPPEPKVEQGHLYEISAKQTTQKIDIVSVDGWDITKEEAEIVQYTNEFRVRNGRRPLKVSGRLMGTSRMQAWLQIRRGMSHGYTSGWGGENIASGQSGSREVVTTWINSSGHRANMLGNWTYIGVGGYSNQWAQQFR